MDENKERRKHYQDLAGIENYASKFDNAGIIKAPLILCVCVRPSVRLLENTLKGFFLLFFFFFRLTSSSAPSSGAL